MAELTTADVDTFTRGRLSADDPVVADMLAAALVRARGYVGWHVSPVNLADEVTVDGPGGRTLTLPTRNLLALTSVTEDDVSLDVSDLNWSAKGLVRKGDGSAWSGDYAAITVVMDHGLSESEAADWRRAILSMVDQMARSQQSGARSDDDLVRKRVDDVEYQWVDYGAMADRALTSVGAILDAYLIGPMSFA